MPRRRSALKGVSEQAIDQIVQSAAPSLIRPRNNDVAQLCRQTSVDANVFRDFQGLNRCTHFHLITGQYNTSNVSKQVTSIPDKKQQQKIKKHPYLNDVFNNTSSSWLSFFLLLFFSTRSKRFHLDHIGPLRRRVRLMARFMN